MNDVLFVSMIVAVSILVVLFGVTAAYGRKAALVPNYRAMFVIGIAFIPLGVTSNYGLLAMGLVFLAVGWRNKDKWGNHTRWVDFPPTLKKLKIASATGLGALVLSIVILFIQRR